MQMMQKYGRTSPQYQPPPTSGLSLAELSIEPNTLDEQVLQPVLQSLDRPWGSPSGRTLRLCRGALTEHSHCGRASTAATAAVSIAAGCRKVRRVPISGTASSVEGPDAARLAAAAANARLVRPGAPMPGADAGC